MDVPTLPGPMGLEEYPSDYKTLKEVQSVIPPFPMAYEHFKSVASGETVVDARFVSAITSSQEVREMIHSTVAPGKILLLVVREMIFMCLGLDNLLPVDGIAWLILP